MLQDGRQTGATGVEASLRTHLNKAISAGSSAAPGVGVPRPSNSFHLHGSHGIQCYKRRSDLGARLIDIGHDEAVIPVDGRQKGRQHRRRVCCQP